VAGITNQGQGPAVGSRTWHDSIYLSQTPFFDAQARLISWWTRSNTVPAGGVYWLTNQITTPAFDSADYYLLFVTDEYNALGEQIVSNNMVISPLSLNLSPPADLTVDFFQAPSLVIGTSEPALSVVSHVLNLGLGPAVGQWSDSVSLAATGVSGYPGPARNVLTNQEAISLLPGEGYWRTNTIQMPEMQSGYYQLTFWTDVSATLYEADRDNNTAVSRVDFSLTSPSPPRFGLGFPQPGGSFVVPVYGSFGKELLLQVSTDLQNWQSLYSFYCTDTPTYLNDWPGGSTSRFYRIVAP
jgi:subtilase family serine protease